MEDRVLPIVFLNLCGEMLYVILQRLEAQNISSEKTSKVIQDILSSMLNDQFTEELFKPQKMYTRLAMQSVFEKLVHSSIMRLNTNSMSKLYDLMLMVFKYQVVNCQHPEDILLVTLNHLDAIKDCARPYPELTCKVQNLYSLLISNYTNLCHEDYECLHSCIDTFLEDLNIRVSVLLKLGLQLPSGEIVKAHNESVRRGVEEKEYQKNIPSCYEFEGQRNFTLGTNIYVQLAVSEQQKCKQQQSLPSASAINPNEKELQGLEEISLLTRLIGKCTSSNSVPEIMLASPNDDEKCDLHDIEVKENCSFVKIDASQVSNQDLEKICSELDINAEGKKNFDVLELLDSVETQ